MTRSMTIYTQPTPTAANTLAGYSDWGSRISAVLGRTLARTGDTGQVTWATLSQAPTAGAVRDFEVYALTDTLQATKPIYIRVDYGLNAGTPFGALMQVWAGTATNGAGVLSGIQAGVSPVVTGQLAGTGARLINTGLYTAAGLPRSCYASSDGSYLSFFSNLQQPGQAGTTADALGAFIVERTRDTDGTANGNGYTMWNWAAAADTGGAISATNVTFTGQLIRAYDLTQPNAYAPAAASFDYGAAAPPGTATTSITGAGPAQGFPVYGSAPQPQGASKALMLAYTADLPRVQPVTLTHYGQATQWISMGTAQPAYTAYANGTNGSVATRTTLSPVFRWE